MPVPLNPKADGGVTVELKARDPCQEASLEETEASAPGFTQKASVHLPFGVGLALACWEMGWPLHAASSLRAPPICPGIPSKEVRQGPSKDVVVGTKDTAHVMGFKYDRSAEEALAQIDERGVRAPRRTRGAWRKLA